MEYTKNTNILDELIKEQEEHIKWLEERGSELWNKWQKTKGEGKELAKMRYDSNLDEIDNANEILAYLLVLKNKILITDYFNWKDAAINFHKREINSIYDELNDNQFIKELSSEETQNIDYSLNWHQDKLNKLHSLKD